MQKFKKGDKVTFVKDCGQKCKKGETGIIIRHRREDEWIVQMDDYEYTTSGVDGYFLTKILSDNYEIY